MCVSAVHEHVHARVLALAKEHQYRKVQEKRSPKYRRSSVRLVGACHITLGEARLGAYPGVGTCPGYYGIIYG